MSSTSETPAKVPASVSGKVVLGGRSSRGDWPFSTTKIQPGHTVLDELIAHELLRVLEPAALELSLRAAEDNQQERDCLHQHWRQRLERAGYEADRAARQTLQ